MLKKIIFTLLFVFSFRVNLPATESRSEPKWRARSDILQTNRVEEIAALIDQDTLALFDVDDTLIQTPTMLGSSDWRKYVRTRIKLLGLDPIANETFAILSYQLFLHVPLQPVDPQFPTLIAQLQEKKIPTIAFTARGRTNWYDVEMEAIDRLTQQNLTEVGINFTKSTLPASFDQNPNFAYGVLFTAQQNKGPALLEFLKTTGYRPAKIVFVDDKLDQVYSVVTALESIGIPCIGVHYTAAETNAKPYIPLIANMQLMLFFQSEGNYLPSDEEVARSLTPVDEIFSAYYLDAAICIAAASAKKAE